MPEMSIVITAQDNYSNAIKKMSLVTRSFSKDQDEMESKLRELTQNQSALQRQLRKSAEELKALEKQCEGATDALAQGRLESERAKYDSLKRNLALVTKGAREAETQMQKTGKAFSQASNRAERDNGMGQVFGEGGWSWTHKKAPSWGRG